MKESYSYERYQRQILLKELGETGQLQLLHAKVLVIGAGGLGCPVLQYLAAAGVGRIGIVDDDYVALSNLHRQVLYGVDDIGLPKATVAAAALRRLNPDICILAFEERLTVLNASEIIDPFGIIVDCSDNFSTRYLINDAAVLLGKTLVYGAVSRFEGQVAVFNQQKPGTVIPANYRDLFPEQPEAGEVLNCEEVGVLGVLPGIIGAMQANEVIKLITGIGEPLINRLLTYNALNNQFFEIQLAAKEETRSLIPAHMAAFLLTNYREECALPEIGIKTFDKLSESENVVLVDVRGFGELPTVNEFPHRRIPLEDLRRETPAIAEETIVIFCQSGKRSKEAAGLLKCFFGEEKKIFSLQGGIENWKKHHAIKK